MIAGDLAVVVRVDHPCALPLLGKFFTVLALDASAPGIFCSRCGSQWMYRGEPVVEYATQTWIPRAWVKRVPPLGELETTQTEEPVEVAP